MLFALILFSLITLTSGCIDKVLNAISHSPPPQEKITELNNYCSNFDKSECPNQKVDDYSCIWDTTDNKCQVLIGVQ